MKKLFYPVYLLLLFVCFLCDVSAGWAGVANFTAERAGKQSLDDLMNSCCI